MSWTDPDPELEAGPEIEEEGQPDILADLDDEVREAFEARLQSEREAAQASLREELEQQFAKDKANLNAGLRQRLRDVAGVEIGEDGLPKAADPMRLATYAAQQLQQGKAKEAEPDDEMPDPTFQAAEFKDWQKRQVERARKEAIEAVKAEFQAEIAQLRGAVLTPAAQNVANAASTYLTDLGFEDYAKDPEFAKQVTDLVRQNVPPGEWNDPKYVRQAVAMIALERDPDFIMKAAAQAQQRQAQRDPSTGQFVSQARQGLAFGQASSGSAGRLGDTGAPRLTAEEQVLFNAMHQAGVVENVQEFLATASNEGAKEYYTKRNGKKK